MLMFFSDAGCPGRGTDLEEKTVIISISHLGVELLLKYWKEEIPREHSDI